MNRTSYFTIKTIHAIYAKNGNEDTPRALSVIHTDPPRLCARPGPATLAQGHMQGAQGSLTLIQQMWNTDLARRSDPAHDAQPSKEISSAVHAYDRGDHASSYATARRR